MSSESSPRKDFSEIFDASFYAPDANEVDLEAAIGEYTTSIRVDVEQIFIEAFGNIEPDKDYILVYGGRAEIDKDEEGYPADCLVSTFVFLQLENEFSEVGYPSILLTVNQKFLVNDRPRVITSTATIYGSSDVDYEYGVLMPDEIEEYDGSMGRYIDFTTDERAVQREKKVYIIDVKNNGIVLSPIDQVFWERGDDESLIFTELTGDLEYDNYRLDALNTIAQVVEEIPSLGMLARYTNVHDLGGDPGLN